MQVLAEKAVNHTSWREENTRYSLRMMLMNSNTKYFRTRRSLATKKKMKSKATKMSNDTPFDAIADSYTSSAWLVSGKNTT